MKQILRIKGLVCLLFIGSCVFQANAQYNLVWSDEFDGTKLDSSKWNVEKNIGIWNTGSNRELEHYKKENVSISNDGNGNNCLVITAKKESYNGYSFTSGKIDTRGKFSVKYGKIEARIKMPNTANGLWPAFWLLGFSPEAWPKCGEIDIAELGQKDGITNSTQNKLISGALHWDENGAYAGYGKKTALGYNMNEDYHVYLLEWTSTAITMYIDNVEYYKMTTGTSKEEFNSTLFYVIFNLAVGGMFPEIYTVDGITAPMPAKMYVDYIRVYQKDGEGELNAAPHKVYGNYGVYDELGVYNFKLDMDADAQIVTSGLTAATKTPFEGTSSLSYTTSSAQDFSLAIEVPAGRNMLNYLDGSLQFRIKTNFTGDLKIGVSNSETGAIATVSSSSEYNFDRNNSWVNVIIPISALTPSINVDNVVQLINISGVGEDGSHIEIDKVFWSETVPANDKYYGIFTENPNISNKIVIDNVHVNLYIWDGTLSTVKSAKYYEGESDLAFKGVAGKTWFGYGIASSNPVDLTAYENGSLHLTLKTSATNEFWIGIGGANKTEGKITFLANTGKYGFKRDGKWYTIEIPMSDLLSGGLDLSGCGNVFMLGGAGVPATITVDDVYLSIDGSVADNPAINPTTDVRSTSLGEISVLPNPASEFISLKGQGVLNSIEILDITGKCLSKQVHVSENEKISISGLTSGMYFIRLNGNNQSQVLKFLKK